MIGVKLAFIFILVRINDLAHHPIACAIIYTAVFALTHAVYSAILAMPLLVIGIYSAVLLLWCIFYFRLLSHTESHTDHLIYSVFGGYVLLAF